VVTVADLCDGAGLERALAGVDAVIHLAGAAHVRGEASADLATFRAANVTAVGVVCAAAARAGARHLVLVSSAGVVGETGDAVVSTDTPARPESAYGRSKLEGELVARETLAATSVRLRVFRPPMVYGPGMRGNPLRLFGLVDSGVPLPLGGVRNRRSVLSAGNLAHAIERAIETDARVDVPLYPSDVEVPSTPELARAIGVALGRPVRLVPVPQWMLDGVAALLETAGAIVPSGVRQRASDIRRLTGSFVVDPAPARDAIGFVPRLSLAEGLAETAAWWRGGRPDVWP
jgi:nucleoside-diphosphate-sugar epimerase